MFYDHTRKGSRIKQGGGGGGGKTRIGPPYPHVRRERRLKCGGFSDKPLKGWPRVGVWTGT